VILTLDDNTNQEFTIPKDQKFDVNGQMLDAFALRKGMRVSATKIVESPMEVTSVQQRVTGRTPPAAPAPKAAEAPAATPAPAEAPAAAPAEVAAEPQHVTGTIPPSPPPDAPLLVAAGAPTPVPAEAEQPATPAEPAPEKPNYMLWVGLAVLLVVILFVVARMRSKPSN
jgi:hypothetical protein